MRVHPKHAALRLFLAPNGKSRNWYAGFHNSGKFVRESMRTSDFDAAKERASEWYEVKRYEIRKGTFVPPSGAKFEALIKPALAGMAAREKSPKYVAAAKTALRENSYVRRYFGKIGVERITSRTWDDFRLWLSELRVDEGKPQHSERSIHQMKNVVRLILRQAYVQKLIDVRPRFEDPLKETKSDSRPRIRFDGDEENALLVACAENIERHRQAKTRWVADAEEMFDFVRFMRSTGLRVGECLALRAREVRVFTDKATFAGKTANLEVCGIRVVRGKRGAHPECKSDPAAAAILKRIIARRGIQNPATSDEPLFLKHHRDMFRELLVRHSLHVDPYGRKRDFVSLRHTYICRKLEQGVPVWEVARNTRTSVAVIEQHYAKNLPVSGALLNQFDYELIEPKTLSS